MSPPVPAPARRRGAGITAHFRPRTAGPASQEPPPRRDGGARAALTLWLMMSALLLLPALLIGGSPRLDRLSDATLAWQAPVVLAEPWRLWSAAWVHLTPDHLSANLIGGLMVAALGWAGRVNRGAVVAWSLAWPATHLALLVHAPLLQHYAGLSGVLHAGVAVMAVRMITGLEQPRALRRIGLALAVGLLLKIGLEMPWRGPMSDSSEWDFPVVVAAHAWGAGLGAVLALLLATMRR